MMRFCAIHGVEVNKENIWQQIKRFDMVAASVRKRLLAFDRESWTSRQLSIPFKKVT